MSKDYRQWLWQGALVWLKLMPVFLRTSMLHFGRTPEFFSWDILEKWRRGGLDYTWTFPLGMTGMNFRLHWPPLSSSCSSSPSHVSHCTFPSPNYMHEMRVSYDKSPGMTLCNLASLCCRLVVRMWRINDCRTLLEPKHLVDMMSLPSLPEISAVSVVVVSTVKDKELILWLVNN